jgi:TRAP-type C4-dicarboxylate transport system permease small subunit
MLIARSLGTIARYGEIGTGSVLAALMFMTFADVFGRYVLNAPVLGGYELTEICIAVIVFGALPAVTARGAHITTGLLEGGGPGRFATFRKVTIGLFSAAALAGLAWRLFVVAEGMAELRTYSPVLKLPLAPLAYLMAATTALAALSMLMRALSPEQAKAMEQAL